MKVIDQATQEMLRAESCGMILLLLIVVAAVVGFCLFLWLVGIIADADKRQRQDPSYRQYEILQELRRINR